MLFGLLATAPVMAEPQPPIDLRWVAPPSCPQESDVHDRIRKILGSGRHGGRLRAEGTITRTDKRFLLELVIHVRDLVGTRSIESTSCEDLAGAAAVEIGLLVHSVEAAGVPNPNDAPPTNSPPVGGPESSANRSDATKGNASPETNDASNTKRPMDSVKEASPVVQGEANDQLPGGESQRHWHVLLQAPLLAWGAGPLPRPTVGVGLSLGFEHARWQLHLEGVYWQRQKVPALGFPGYGADVDRIGATLWVCREFRHSWFGLSPCLAAGIDRISASGTGTHIASSEQHTIGIRAGAGVQGRLYLASWIRLLVAVEGEVELVRPQIEIKGLGPLDPNPATEPPATPTPVYRFAPAALTGTLSLEWAL